jgi:hypothetical protein
LIDNLVRSWTFAALEQILRETATSSLPFTRYKKDSSSVSSGKSLSFGGQSKEQKLRVSEQKSMIHPSRSSSLNHGRTSADPPYAQQTNTGQVVFENGQYHDRPALNQESAVPHAKNGMQELAGTRAQLVVVQRRLLEQIGGALGWSIGWAAVLPVLNHHEELSDVDLHDEDKLDSDSQTTGKSTATSLDVSTVGIAAETLKVAVSSLDQFRQSFEVSNGPRSSGSHTDYSEGYERPDRETLYGSRPK